MDKTYETQLLNDLDDALFRVLMNRVAEHEGAAALARNAQLNQDPNAALPPALEKKCQKLIRDTFAAKSRSTAPPKTKAQRRIFSWKTLQKVAVVAILLVTTVSLVFAAFPTVRTATLNMFLDIHETYTDFFFHGDPPQSTSSKFDIHPGWLPDGFFITEEDAIQDFSYQYYKNNDGVILLFKKSIPTTTSIDTEDAEINALTVQGYEGQIITKGTEISIVWLNKEENIVYFINSNGIDYASMVKIAQNCK